MRSLSPRAGAALLLLFCAAPARSHDFWIAPSTFHPRAGQQFDVGLRVGEQFVGEPVPRTAEQIERFVAVGAHTELPIAGQDHRDPAGRIALLQEGLYVLGYRSHRTSVQLGAAQFESYLRQEGLERVLALRAERGEAGEPGREVFSRCTKALIQVGDKNANQSFDRVLGFTLEIVPLSNPLIAKAGDPIPFRLLFEGRPLVGALVTALPEDAYEPAISARTNDSGIATFRLARPGVYMIKTVHMVPASRKFAADWESFWASLTFRSGAE